MARYLARLSVGSMEDMAGDMGLAPIASVEDAARGFHKLYLLQDVHTVEVSGTDGRWYDVATDGHMAEVQHISDVIPELLEEPPYKARIQHDDVEEATGVSCASVQEAAIAFHKHLGLHGCEEVVAWDEEDASNQWYVLACDGVTATVYQHITD